MDKLNKVRGHGYLTGIINEPPSLKEGIFAALVLGIPFALAFAFLYDLLV